MEVAVCGSLRNFVGRDGSNNTRNWKGDVIPLGAKKNRNTFRQAHGLKGIYLDSEGVDTTSLAWGNLSLVTAEEGEVTYRTSSVRNDWGIIEVSPTSVTLEVVRGTISLKTLTVGTKSLRKKISLKEGQSLSLPLRSA